MIGTGYVGLVSGVCFADIGNQVICVDKDKNKIDKLNFGVSPIYEPGLDELIKKNFTAKRLSFTTDINRAISTSDIIFICVGTPTKKVAFYTLGCKLNFSETSSIARDFVKYGYEKVKFDSAADFYVINTCSVTENADKEAKKLIRKAKRISPNSKIAVIGCFAQLQPNVIAKLNEVDIVLGASDKFDLIKYLNETNVEISTKVIRSDIDEVNSFKPSYSMDERTRSYLKVQDGCDYTCSFCTIPLARGRSRSGTISDTIKAAKDIAESGNKEIVLTGVNIGDFGKGSDDSFINLINELDRVKGIDRIRISSIEPNLLTNEIIKFCNS